MKNLTILFLLLATAMSIDAQTSETKTGERYGNTLNLGIGFGGYSGYYRYVGRTLPVVNLNYEFDVAPNFTLAPFISFYSYTNSYYWGNKNTPYRYYNYHESVIPIGIRGSLFLDKFLRAGSKWDFYLAGSAGFAIVNRSWDLGYEGDKNYYHHGNPLFLDLHIGTEYHFTQRIGGILDISNGVSSIGLAFHK